MDLVSTYIFSSVTVLYFFAPEPFAIFLYLYFYIFKIVKNIRFIHKIRYIANILKLLFLQFRLYDLDLVEVKVKISIFHKWQ